MHEFSFVTFSHLVKRRCDADTMVCTDERCAIIRSTPICRIILVPRMSIHHPKSRPQSYSRQIESPCSLLNKGGKKITEGVKIFFQTSKVIMSVLQVKKYIGKPPPGPPPAGLQRIRNPERPHSFPTGPVHKSATPPSPSTLPMPPARWIGQRRSIFRQLAERNSHAIPAGIRETISDPIHTSDTNGV